MVWHKIARNKPNQGIAFYLLVAQQEERETSTLKFNITAWVRWTIALLSEQRLFVARLNNIRNAAVNVIN